MLVVVNPQNVSYMPKSFIRFVPGLGDVQVRDNVAVVRLERADGQGAVVNNLNAVRVPVEIGQSL